MKKLLFSLTLITSMSVSAQKVAKDFTFTDVKGVEHNLYDYLDQGKTVIIDVSAAWCGPCWAFHQTHILEDLYKQHGPAGEPGVDENTTDDVIVLFLEGEQTNTINQLNGIQGNTGNSYADATQGNWIGTTIYPIIDLPNNSAGNAVMSNFGVNSFPSIYKVCPNRLFEDVGRTTVEAYHAMAQACPPAGKEDIDVAFLNYDAKEKICGPVTYSPRLTIQNKGTQNLKNVQISIKIDGTEVSTGTYNSSVGMSPYTTKVITCSSIANYSGGELEITIVTDGDTDQSNNVQVVMVEPAKEVTSRVLLAVTTDDYPDEISWSIKSESGATVSGTSMSAGMLTGKNTNYNYEYNLPGVGCYTFVVGDSYGDGTTKIDFFDVSGTVIFNDPTIGGLKSQDIPFRVATDLGVDDNGLDIVGIYPNPATDKVTIQSKGLTAFETIELFDQLGRKLETWNVGNTQMDIDVSHVAEGNYLLVFKGKAGNQTQQLSVRR